MPLLYLYLFAGLQQAATFPVCEINTGFTYTSRHAVNIEIWHVSISGHLLVPSSPGLLSVDEPGSAVVIPVSWTPPDTAIDTQCYAACHACTLASIGSAGVVNVMMTLSALVEIAGGELTWMTANGRIETGAPAPGRMLARYGQATAVGCALSECMLSGVLGKQNVRVGVSLTSIGIGLHPRFLPPDRGGTNSRASLDCTTLLVHPSLRLPVCPQQVVCRNKVLCLHQTYALPDDSDVDVELGIDPLLENNMYLVLHMTDNSGGQRLSIGVDWTGTWWIANNLGRTALLMALMVCSVIWQLRPMTDQVQSATAKHYLTRGNELSIAVLTIAAGYTVYDDFAGSIQRTTETPHAVSIMMGVLMVVSVCIEAVVLLHGHLFPGADTVDIRHLTFSAMLCQTILLVSMGASAHDMQTLTASGAALVWLYTVGYDSAMAFMSRRVVVQTAHAVAFIAASPLLLTGGIMPVLVLLNFKNVVHAVLAILLSAIVVLIGADNAIRTLRS